jgi:two-component system response regulator HydG
VKAYQAHNYALASKYLEKSFGFERDVETLFAWAQSERQLDHCDKASELTGETGTGKTMIARAIHDARRRAPRLELRARGAAPRAIDPFVAINCAALPEALLESELFGHVKGAFTGAIADHVGLFAAAAGGTVLLDEIAEMPLALQAKLLRVLETNSVRPVGATHERSIDARVIAATHRDLRRTVAAGTFREDLLYRLDVVSIDVPPLRHRTDDIAPLVDRFLADARTRHPAAPGKAFARGAMRRLLDHPWPGNVRELAHAVERGVLLAKDAEIAETDLGLVTPPQGDVTWSGEVVPMIEIQRRYARWALDQHGGHKTRTAEQLDVDVKTLNRWLAGDDSDR